jgi:hypothetical protein
MEPIYRVQRREPGAEPVQRVEPPRLLTPAEREQAKKERARKRRAIAKSPAKDRKGGADYRA